MSISPCAGFTKKQHPLGEHIWLTVFYIQSFDLPNAKGALGTCGWRSVKPAPLRIAQDPVGELWFRVQSRVWGPSSATFQMNYLDPLTCSVTYEMGVIMPA